MKRIFAMLLILAIFASLVACSNNSEKPIINDEISDNDKSKAPNHMTEDEIYSNKVYYVGDDIPVGSYAIKCTKAEYGMEILVFESEQKFRDFQGAEQFTVGEYRIAVETHAWADFYVEEGEFAYIGLKNGYVILLDDGMCEFNRHDTDSLSTIYSGIYVIGEDIAAENLDIKCESDYMQVIVFASKDDYISYHKTDRFTVGEESDAIKKYSLTSNYISEDERISVNLKDGMVLIINDGVGEYVVDSGPSIN